MELIVNDLSIHGQFLHVSAFREAFKQILKARNLARRIGKELVSHREFVCRHISPTTTVFEAIQTFNRDEKRAILGWLTRQGPFWEDRPAHSVEEWFECRGELVTETVLAEAAYANHLGFDYRTVSLSPSDWTLSPISVLWKSNSPIEVEIHNYWELRSLISALEQQERPLDSWSALETISRQRFDMLSFTQDCFTTMGSYPFAKSAAMRIFSRLKVLNLLAMSIDESGHRTTEGHRLYREYFTGDNAFFSDSSDSEKIKFRENLTFQHPEKSDQVVVCGWHGKVHRPPFRIHFCWPFQNSSKFHVVHVGRKLTTR